MKEVILTVITFRVCFSNNLSAKHRKYIELNMLLSLSYFQNPWIYRKCFWIVWIASVIPKKKGLLPVSFQSHICLIHPFSRLSGFTGPFYIHSLPSNLLSLIADKSVVCQGDTPLLGLSCLCYSFSYLKNYPLQAEIIIWLVFLSLLVSHLPQSLSLTLWCSVNWDAAEELCLPLITTSKDQWDGAEVMKVFIYVLMGVLVCLWDTWNSCKWLEMVGVFKFTFDSYI